MAELLAKTANSHLIRLEAWGFEPQSRDNVNDGLYMLIRCFDLNAGDEHRHPSPASSRLNLAFRPTAESEGQPALCGRRDAGITSCRGRLN